MKQILCCALLLFGSMAANACDACGASSGNQGLGILPQFYRNFAGLQYQYRSFSSMHNGEETGVPPEATDEQYNTIQAWGRYGIGKRVQLFAFVPYHSNMQSLAGVNSRVSGIGDISVMGNIILIKTTDTNNYKHLLFAGGGVKAPTGEYTGVSQRDKEGLPNMQPGTGSWDFMANANYTYSGRNLGINTEVSYALTTPNRDNYKYGNRLNATVAGFYSQKLSALTLLPSAGIRYEYTLHDYDNYTKKWLNEETGGTMLYGTIGMQAYYKRMGIQLNMDLPLAQHYAAGNVTARYKAGAGLLFMF